ncbi:beta-1,3-galactosyltransferase 6-like [Argonauta hians]
MASRLRKLSARYGMTVCMFGVLFTISLIFCLSACSWSFDNSFSQQMRQDLRYINSRTYWKKVNSVTKQTLSCFLVVLIVSAPSDENFRAVLRETWLSKVPQDVVTRFVIGTAGLPPDLTDRLSRENVRHQDLILLPGVVDSYRNLTLKVLEGFLWIDNNIDYKYVLKTDQDTYVRLGRIEKELRSTAKDRLYWGFFDGRAHVKKQGKWKEQSFVLCDRYLPYAVGGGYVLSADLVHFIAVNRNLLQLFHSEDVSVGVWLAPLAINRIHDPRFDTEYMSRGCNNLYLVTHKQSMQDIQKKHEHLLKNGHLCMSEFKRRRSYVYNWDVLPTQCCDRTNYTIP